LLGIILTNPRTKKTIPIERKIIGMMENIESIITLNMPAINSQVRGGVGLKKLNAAKQRTPNISNTSPL